jgi:hypothetical protein
MGIGVGVRATGNGVGRVMDEFSSFLEKRKKDNSATFRPENNFMNYNSLPARRPCAPPAQRPSPWRDGAAPAAHPAHTCQQDGSMRFLVFVYY